MRYNFNTDNLMENENEKNTVKTRYINSLNLFFPKMKNTKYYFENPTKFDKDLKESINKKIGANNEL